MKKKTYIIVPVHNRLSLTQDGLKYLNEAINLYYESDNANIFDFQILVVDDGSTDGTSEWINENFKEITTLKGNGNLWWSGSINLALEYLKNKYYDFVLLWNDDIKPTKDYFINLNNWIKLHIDNNTIICSKVFEDFDSNILFHAGCLFDSRTGRKTIIGFKKEDNGEFDQVREIDWCGGMGVLIPGEVIEKVGFFDEVAFPQYHGDADFMLRAKQKDLKIVMVPQLKIFNNKKTTGLTNPDIKTAIKSLTSLRSNYNLRKDILFYKRHTLTKKAYFELVKKYGRFFGGAVKNNLIKLMKNSK